MKSGLIIFIILISQTLNKLPEDAAVVTWGNTRRHPAVKSINELPFTPKAAGFQRQGLPFPSTVVTSIQEIPPTPKADQLKNHFGTKKEENFYGPQGTAGANNTVPYAFTLSDGSKYNPIDYTEVSRNFPQSEPDIDPQATKLKKIIVASDQPCIIEIQPWFQLCNSLNTCERCVTGGSRCGWCEYSGQCIPGDVKGPGCGNACPAHTFKRAPRHCIGGPTAGAMTNVAPEAKGLITPTIKGHLGKSGPYDREIDNAGTVRVISGDFTNLATDASGVFRPEYRSSPMDTYTPSSFKAGTYVGEVKAGRIGMLAPNATGLINPSPPNVTSSQWNYPNANGLFTKDAYGKSLSYHTFKQDNTPL